MWDNLFDEMKKMQSQIDKTFERLSSQITFPEFKEAATDISETDNSITLKVDMPGVKKEDIDLVITENSISIKAERKGVIEEKKEGFYKRERNYKGYNIYRTLPVKVKAETADAKYEDGVLTVKLEKAEKTKEKAKQKVKVK